MSCATTIDHATPAGPMLPGLLAPRPTQWIDQSPRRRAENPRAAVNIARHGLADSANTDPEHVWGDEGPVND